MRRIISVAVLCALALAPIPRAVAGEGARSGTIVTGGAGLDYFVGDRLAGCEMSPDCRAWLETDCNPALTGGEPALTASIVDVSELADGATSWVFRFETDFEYGGRARVELWQQDCEEIASSRWRSTDCNGDGKTDYCESTTFSIPQSARWMTVTGYPSGPPWISDVPDPGWMTLDWTLTARHTGLTRH